MDDLISRQAAIDRIKRQKSRPDTFGWWIQNDTIANLCYEIAIETLEKLPSTEPEIVRCKDCIHKPLWEDGDVRCPDDDCPCYCTDTYYSWIPDDDWFCGNGKRAEE